ncbi:MAG: hypothetical protein IJS01_08965 [Lentisphaeria bacterium]|nr:hypothetical protein [Lentisphaeria bacterium]
MKRFFLLAALFCALLVSAEEKPYFPELRRKIARTAPRSDEDYALGDELLAELGKLAATRKRALPRTTLIMETVNHRATRLWYTTKHWRDRQLYANRKYWRPDTPYPYESLLKTFGLMEIYGISANNFFISKTFAPRYYGAMKAGKIPPGKFSLIPTITPAGFAIERDIIAKLPDQACLKEAINSPYTMKFDGRPLFLGYSSERCKPKQLKEFIGVLEKIGGRRIAFISDQAGNGPQIWLGGEWAKHGKVPGTSLLRAFDWLCAVLEYADGIEYGYYVGANDLTLYKDFYDSVLLPLFGAACARGKYNGKRIFAVKTVQGYTNCNGSQTVDSDGTKTIRGFFELADRHRIDLLCGFEWDELNENTNLEPTVAKPWANGRIIRYCINKIKGVAPSPLPGDDLSRPDLVVSTNRQLCMGQEFVLELLNVPDGSKEKYTVAAELYDDREQLLHRTQEYAFDSTELHDHTLVLPTEKFTHSMFIQPRLRVTYKGKTETVAGLPPTVLRGTVNIDHTWFSVPLRNLLAPEKAEVKFVTGQQVRPGAVRVTAEADLKFKEELNAAEILVNSQDLFSYDKFDEFRFNDKSRKLYRLSLRHVIPVDKDKKIRQLIVSCDIKCPGAWSFNGYKVSEPARPRPLAPIKKMHLGRVCEDILIAVPVKNLPGGSLTVAGMRLAGTDKGKPYAHTFRFSDIDKAGVSSVVFDDGLALALESDPKTPRLPLELDLKELKFSRTLLSELPDGVLTLRVVSNSGKVWYSPGYTPVKANGPMVPSVMISSRRGPVKVELPASRVPDFSYDFDMPETGYILFSPAGRDFFAHAGSFLSLGTGFEGIIHGYTIPWAYGVYSSAPRWITLPDGKRALKFDGKTTQGLFLPNTFIPQRHAFTVTFDLIPDDVTREQMLWDCRGPQTYLAGYRLSVKDGRLILAAWSRTPYKRSSPPEMSFKTDVPLVAGKRQKIRLSFDGTYVAVEANGKTARFELPGITHWLTISAFGGTGKQRFAGTLCGLSTRHGLPEKSAQALDK